MRVHIQVEHSQLICVLLDRGSGLAAPKDGMDQSKWAIPRVRGDRVSKEWEQLDRPRTKVHGVWVHYHELMLFVADARTSTGSDFVIECACRALERVVARCHSNNMPVPSEVVIWCDNTVSETKNAWVLQWLCVLLLKRKFRFACVQMSLVGHTNNCLDQIYGHLTIAFRYLDCLSDCQDVCQTLERALACDGHSILLWLLGGLRKRPATDRTIACHNMVLVPSKIDGVW